VHVTRASVYTTLVTKKAALLDWCCEAPREKNGKVWKELDQTKRMRPTFSDQPFKSYSSLKMTCLKMKSKNCSVFCDLRFEIFLILTSTGRHFCFFSRSFQAS
jgi:hypothetical protein